MLTIPLATVTNSFVVSHLSINVQSRGKKFSDRNTALLVTFSLRLPFEKKTYSFRINIL